MPKYFWILLALIFYLPPTAEAEFQPSQRRWTVGYENGVTIRRFLGDNWEIFLGGGPNDSLGESHRTIYRDVVDEFSGMYSQNGEDTKVEEGYVFLGTGRTLIRDHRFWLAGTFSVKYRWSNYQTSQFLDNFYHESYQSSQITGHDMTTTAYLGFRPAYDITSRITMMLSMGIYFSHQTSTWDKWAVDEEYPVYKKRFSSNQDDTGLFGYYGIQSISFFFRF